MLQLVDQSDMTNMRYRCDVCHAEGRSTWFRSPEGFFWHAQPNNPLVPGRWVVHECRPDDIEAAQKRIAKQVADAQREADRLATKPAAPEAAPEPPPETEVPAPKRRGRPKKTVVLTE